MPTRRKRATANIKQASNYIPPYNYYPQYGYMPPPVYNPVYTQPTPPNQNPVYVQPAPSNQNPVYVQPAPSNQNPEYIYYPLDAYGQIVGSPTTFPPVVNQPYQGSYPYSDYISNVPTHGSYIHSPRRDQMLYEDYYYHHPHSDRSYEKSRRESLPPIRRHPFSSTRLASPNGDEYQQFVVRDLTERGSASSVLSNKNVIRRMEHYDKLRKSYR